jgi:hypothetical protein
MQKNARIEWENDGMTINGVVGKFKKHPIIVEHEVAMVIR